MAVIGDVPPGAQPVSPRGVAGDVVLACAMYFCFFMAIGSVSPFLTLYYDSVGLNSEQIGLLIALPVAISSVTVMVWGYIADTYRLHRPILRGGLVAATLSILLVSQMAQFGALLAAISLWALMQAPLLPLIDSAALETVERRKLAYSDLRVWGTIGWIVANLLLGTLTQEWGLKWMFYVCAMMFGVGFFLALLQPKRAQTLRAPVLTGLRDLLSRRDFVIFLTCIFLVGVSASGSLAFFSLYMQRLGAREGIIGISWAISSGAEAVVIGLSGWILKRVSVRQLLMVGFFVYAVRWLILSFITDPNIVLVAQLLHGLSFAPVLVAGVTYVNERTPEGMGATAQSLYLFVSFGVSQIAGALVGGYLFERLPLDWYFRVFSLIATIGLVLFVVAKPREEKKVVEGQVG